MQISLRILIGQTGQLATGITWGDVINTWETYAKEWNEADNLAVDPTEAPVLDMFGDEGISIKQIIKDLKDPKKLFTDYSRSFTVPASKKNNRIFKHYYNIDITNGLDSRELVPARILMNNVTYKLGNIRVDSVKMNKGVAMSYKITFIGKLSELSRQIGQDRLSDIDFSDLNLASFNAQTEVTNLTKRPLMFPLNSKNERLLFDTSTGSFQDANGNGIENSRNIGYKAGEPPADDYGLKRENLAGALAVGTIIDRIESKYGFNFTGVLNEDYVRELYLWLFQTENKREDAQLEGSATLLQWTSGVPADFESIELTPTSFTYNDIQPVTDRWYELGHFLTEVRFKGDWVGDATVSILENGQVIRTVETSGQYTGWITLRDRNDGSVYTFKSTSGSSLSVDLRVEFKYSEFREDPIIPDTENYQLIYNLAATGEVNVGSGGSFIISENMPKMTVMQFLGDLFKMFNVVAEIDDTLTVSTKHYDHFMSEGSVKEVTEYVDVSEYEIERPNIYSAMQMDWAEPKTALELGYLAVNGKQYGELAFELFGDNDVRLSGDVYNLKIENQRIPAEPLYNLATSSRTNVVYTQFSDLKGAEQNIKPGFTYIVLKNGGDSISYFDNIVVQSSTLACLPSNTYNRNWAIPNDVNDIFGLYYGEEISEHGDSKEGLGIFNNFYRGITAMMFDEDKRRVKFKSYLPDKILINLSLADTLKISNHYYNINSIETNYLTGVSVLELTLVGRSRLRQFDKNFTVTNNISTDLHITYVDVNGAIAEATLVGNSSSNLPIVGGVVGSSHSEYDIEKT